MGQPLLPSTFAGELWFCIVIAIVGMLLLAMLVGNMQVRAAGFGVWDFGIGVGVWSTGVGGLDLGSLYQRIRWLQHGYEERRSWFE